MLSKAKWFAVRKPSTLEVIATTANQIVTPKFQGPTKMYYIHQTPLSSCSIEGGSGDETSEQDACRTISETDRWGFVLLHCRVKKSVEGTMYAYYHV